MNMKTPAIALLSGIVCLCPAAAQAQTPALTFSFVNSDQKATMGTATDFTFTGELLNTTGSRIYLTDDNLLFGAALDATTGLTLGGSQLITNDPNFDSNGFDYIDPGPSNALTLDIFTVSTSASTKVGTYSGSYFVDGGADPNNTGPLFLPQPFSVSVLPPSVPPTSAVPEPGSLSLLGLGLVGLGFTAIRRRRA